MSTMSDTEHFKEFVRKEISMDRRQQKTRAAIFRAFSHLLENKSFNNITVQEIIDEANVGRSTFYAHFETKDELLKAMCTDIFNHVFSSELVSEKTHDFSTAHNNLKDTLTHILYHLQDSKKDIVIGVLSCESGELFMKYFKEYLSELFRKYLPTKPQNVPVDFMLNHLIGSFAETVKWWSRNDMSYTPEETVHFFMMMTTII